MNNYPLPHSADAFAEGIAIGEYIADMSQSIRRARMSLNELILLEANSAKTPELKVTNIPGFYTGVKLALSQRREERGVA